MRKTTRILAGVALAAFVVAPVAAGTAKTFTATLDPLNAGSHTVDGTTYTIPTASGTATVRLSGNAVSVDISVDGVTPLTLHPQHIHAGLNCPSASDDANGDGFVDVIEGLPKYGPVLISLDTNINDGAAAEGLMFPTSDADGSYTYSAEGSRSHLQDEIETALKVGSRHIVIHGISPDANEMPLPNTVASLPGLPAWATLPVACGELNRVK